LPEAAEQRGLTLAGFGHQQRVAAQQYWREMRRHPAATAILGHSEAGALGHRFGQGQESAGGRALDQRYVVASLHEVPKPGQLART